MHQRYIFMIYKNQKSNKKVKYIDFIMVNRHIRNAQNSQRRVMRAVYAKVPEKKVDVEIQ